MDYFWRKLLLFVDRVKRKYFFEVFSRMVCCGLVSNQIYLVTFMCLTFDKLASSFIDISNAEIAQWFQKWDVILVTKLF